MGIPRQVVTNTRSSHTGLRINSPTFTVGGWSPNAIITRNSASEINVDMGLACVADALDADSVS